MRVLVADADPDFAKTARLALRSESMVVDVVAEAGDALERAAAVPYTVMVIDLAMPGARGVDLLKRLRRNHVVGPILAIIADTKLEARIEALRFGADDCLVRPVIVPELAARVHALARRAARKAGDCLEVEDLVLHCGNRHAFRAGRALPLTEREFLALEYLVRAHGRPVPAAELLELLWHEKEAPKDNFIAVLMMRLRKKVDDVHETPLVRTLRGQGYVVGSAGD
jgi:two-component system OmpR family response regulator